MLDQSFSAENFRRILDYENRKGVYLEGKKNNTWPQYFSGVKNVTEQIKQINVEIREQRKVLPKDDFWIYKNAANKRKKELRDEKNQRLTEELQKISQAVVNSKFRMKLTKNQSMGEKPIYTVPGIPENFFALKQIQYNFRKLYKVKQSSRYAIVSQLKGLLNDKFPKYVIKTDINEFYESIPHEKLFQKLNEENLLTFYSKKIIYQILDEYKEKSGSNLGLPRGVGISAYLAELYMRDFDNLIKSMGYVTYYARYVDDIIIVFTPSSIKEPRNFTNEIDKILENKFGLSRNRTKTLELDLVDTCREKEIEFLGYKIRFGNGPVTIKLSQKKINKYKTRIDLVLKSYVNYSKVNEKKARRLLVKRVKFLTGNTRLVNNKKNILVGIYFSNSQLNDISDLIGLDAYLQHQVEVILNNNTRLVERLSKWRFEEGFKKKRFAKFTTNELSEIIKTWQRI